MLSICFTSSTANFDIKNENTQNEIGPNRNYAHNFVKIKFVCFCHEGTPNEEKKIVTVVHLYLPTEVYLGFRSTLLWKWNFSVECVFEIIFWFHHTSSYRHISCVNSDLSYVLQWFGVVEYWMVRTPETVIQTFNRPSFDSPFTLVWRTLDCEKYRTSNAELCILFRWTPVGKWTVARNYTSKHRMTLNKRSEYSWAGIWHLQYYKFQFHCERCCGADERSETIWCLTTLNDTLRMLVICFVLFRYSIHGPCAETRVRCVKHSV